MLSYSSNLIYSVTFISVQLIKSALCRISGEPTAEASVIPVYEYIDISGNDGGHNKFNKERNTDSGFTFTPCDAYEVHAASKEQEYETIQ